MAFCEGWCVYVHMYYINVKVPVCPVLSSFFPFFFKVVSLSSLFFMDQNKQKRNKSEEEKKRNKSDYIKSVWVLFTVFFFFFYYCLTEEDIPANLLCVSIFFFFRISPVNFVSEFLSHFLYADFFFFSIRLFSFIP